MTNDEGIPVKQYRRRIKGFAKYASFDNGEDEFVEIPDECPNICSASGVFLEPMTFTEPTIQAPPAGNRRGHLSAGPHSAGLVENIPARTRITRV